MPYDLVSEFGAYVDAGGWVMPPLILGTLVLWFAIGYRFYREYGEVEIDGFAVLELRP